MKKLKLNKENKFLKKILMKLLVNNRNYNKI